MTSAVVTGSNGGIGSVTVNAFEAAGFSVHAIPLLRAVVYPATASFVTGAVLTVDGGWTAR